MATRAATVAGLVATAALLARTHTRTVVDHAPTEPDPAGPSEEERVRRARQELTEVIRTASAGLLDAHHYLDAVEDDAASHVRLVAAHHQLTSAMHALGRARAALPSPDGGAQ